MQVLLLTSRPGGSEPLLVLLLGVLSDSTCRNLKAWSRVWGQKEYDQYDQCDYIYIYTYIHIFIYIVGTQGFSSLSCHEGFRWL